MGTTVRKLSFYKRPEDIFSRYRKEPMAVYLDSSLENHLGRYSIIGLHPYLTIQEKEGRCYRNGVLQEQSMETVLKEYLRENREENLTHLPLIAGAVGYLSYDYGRKFEQIPTRHGRELQMPDALFCFYEVYIIADLRERELYLAVGGDPNRREKKILQLTQEIGECVPEEKPIRQRKLAEFRPNFTREEYMEAIGRMKGYMEEGHIYVANMTQQLVMESQKDPYEVFCYLRRHNPSPFGGYMNYGACQIVSASVERFLKLKGRRIETRPIKGTRKRGSTSMEDVQLRRELEESEKDKSELLMIVDLERNDLNRVCVPGSVKVTEHFKVEEYATVFQLVSSITGELRPELDAVDLIQAAFPGGSITGAPKIRAMEIIDELEHGQRGLYTGSIGYLSLNGDCDLNIVIRTAVWENGRYYLGAGGGITYESDVAFEYEETLQKAKAIREAIYE